MGVGHGGWGIVSYGGFEAWWLWVWAVMGLRHGVCGSGSWWVYGGWGRGEAW